MSILNSKHVVLIIIKKRHFQKETGVRKIVDLIFDEKVVLWSILPEEHFFII